jgi:hypothetical protein
MRAIAALVLGMSIAAMPILANDAKEAGNADLPTAPTPVKVSEAAKPENAVIESEIQDLRSLVEEQRAELEAQRAAMKAATLKMEALEEKLHTTPAEPAAAPAAVAPAASEPITSSIGSASRTLSTAAAIPAQGVMEEKPSPLYFRIGTAEFFPLGFMDATSIYRTTDLTAQGGGTIGTSFGSIPYNNTVTGRLSDLKFSNQNSRIGMRVHAKVGESGDITGYLEADFLGYLAPSGNVTSNSDSLRLRLFWANYKQGMWEVQGGQSWSLLTPNRNGLSALPGDLFYGQEMDTNYYLGLTWTRATGIRVIAHPTKNWAIGVSLENPQQLLPNTVVVPGNITAASAQNGQYGGQFDTNSGNTSNATGVNNTSIPNLAPDIIVKTAFDAVPGGHHFHFDLAGLERNFKAVNLLTTPTTAAGVVTSNATQYTTLHGGGVAATLNVEVIKNLRAIVTSYYSYAGGRYIGNTSGPDVIVKSDGTLSGVHSGSGLGGFEYQVTPKWMFYAYYSGAYFGRNLTANPGGATLAGYGAPGAANASSADRYLYEPEFGFVNTMWRNPNYGDLKIITQYGYLSRTPWAVAVGAPATAHQSVVYIDLRYDLP